ncbi:MAG: hypothetical protein JNM94_18280 [Phycisphaerae bacterium]|nr:hypothetical protein [Phycisphaerae bacterium]
MSATTTNSLLENAIRDLERLASRARLLIVSRRVIGLAAAAIGAGAVTIALDWIFRFPAPFRAIVLLLGLAVLAMFAWRLVVPAMRFRPTPTQLALRIERSSPSLRGRLASGIEFAMTDAGRESELAARSMSDLAARLSSESIRSWLAPRRSLAEVSTALATIVVVALVAALLPTHARIGVTRLLLPFSQSEWPARTHVESLMPPITHHAKGQPILLAAKLSEGDAASERVAAVVTVTRDDGTVSTDRLMLTRQRDGRYERVLEGDPTVGRLDIRFASSDHESPSMAIELVPPPKIETATLKVDPPAYASGVIEPRSVDLGDGTDDRAIAREPALFGSSARLELMLNKPIPAGEWSKSVGSTNVEGADDLPSLRFDPDPADGRRWTIAWTVTGPREITLVPTDEHHISAVDDIRFRLDAVEDRPPMAAVTAPASDETVLPTAVVPVAVEARDDVALAKAGILVSRFVGGKGNGDVVRDGVSDVATTLDRREESLDLAALGAAPGDVFAVQAAAQDGFDLDGQKHERVLSAPRTLRVISEVELGKQLRAQLAAVRRAAVRLDSQQAELSAAALNGRFDPTLERGQAQVSERLRDATESLDELVRRVERNRLADEELSATLEQARELVASANRGSSRASEAMQRKREATTPDAAKDAATEAVTAQEEVRADLEDLIKLLDRDEDSWAMGREIDRLREQIEGLKKRTASLGERTVGQKPEDLKEPEKSELDSLAKEQDESARDAQKLIDELRTRAEAVEKVDKSRANAMRDAAKAGEERRLQRSLEQAGKDVEENRMQQAQQGQQSALDALDRMRKGLEDVRKARAEELRRALESLEQSLERLIATNEEELINLARVAGPGDEDALGERGRAMVKLAQNTQAVAGEARAIGSEAGRIARTIDRAADNHGAAVGFIRAKPARLEDAKAAEERGLALLKEALESSRQVRQQSEQREREQKMQEILAAYRQLLEKELGLRDATLVLRPAVPNAKLDRRGLIESRRLSIAQGEVGTRATAMLEEHTELKEAEVFVEAHGLIADWASRASQRLSEGTLDDETVALETQIADAISGLVDALAPAAPDDNPFQENQPNSNGNNGGNNGGNNPPQPKLPPIAELKLLRSLQVQIFERTKRLDGQREASGNGEAVPAIDAELDSLARLQERLVGLLEGVIRKNLPPAPPEGGEGGGDPTTPAPPEPGGDPSGEPTGTDGDPAGEPPAGKPADEPNPEAGTQAGPQTGPQAGPESLPQTRPQAVFESDPRFRTQRAAHRDLSFGSPIRVAFLGAVESPSRVVGRASSESPIFGPSLFAFPSRDGMLWIDTVGARTVPSVEGPPSGATADRNLELACSVAAVDDYRRLVMERTSR